MVNVGEAFVCAVAVEWSVRDPAICSTAVRVHLCCVEVPAPAPERGEKLYEIDLWRIVLTTLLIYSIPLHHRLTRTHKYTHTHTQCVDQQLRCARGI